MRENFAAWKNVMKVEKKRAPRHVSMHDPNLAPSYSTFAKKKVITEVKEVKKKIYVKPKLPSKHVLEQAKLAALKSRANKNKNFVHDNAVHLIQNSSKQARKVRARVKKIRTVKRFITKKDFGRKPTYLENVKFEIDLERKALKEAIIEESEKQRKKEQAEAEDLTEEERLDTLNALKGRWAELNKQFQNILNAQTLVKLNQREQLEKALKQIEQDIKIISHKSIVLVK